MKTDAIIKSIYNALENGSAQYREWLYEAIKAHFYNTEPPVYKVEHNKGRFVVCAALIHGGTIICGPRHFDKVMCDQIEALEYGLAPGDGSHWEQGFVDQYGVFMDRKEALQVATDAGQINVRGPKTHPETQLFSEDLY